MSPLSSFPAFVPTSTAYPALTSPFLAAHHPSHVSECCDRCHEGQATSRLHSCAHIYCTICTQKLLENSICDQYQSMRLLCLICGQRVTKFLPLPSAHEFACSMPRETNENNQIEECFGTDSEYDSESVILPIKIDRSSATPINLLIKPKHDQAPSTIMFVSPEPTPETKEQQSTSTYSSLLNKVCRKFSSLTTFTSTSKSSDFPPTPVSPIRMPDFNEPQQAFGNFTAINDPPPRKSKMSRTRSVPTETVETSLVKRRRRRAKGKSYSVNACFEIMRIEPPKDPVLPGTRALFDDSFPMPAGRRAPAEMLFELP